MFQERINEKFKEYREEDVDKALTYSEGVSDGRTAALEEDHREQKIRHEFLEKQDLNHDIQLYLEDHGEPRKKETPDIGDSTDSSRWIAFLITINLALCGVLGYMIVN